MAPPAFALAAVMVYISTPPMMRGHFLIIYLLHIWPRSLHSMPMTSWRLLCICIVHHLCPLFRPPQCIPPLPCLESELVSCYLNIVDGIDGDTIWMGSQNDSNLLPMGLSGYLVNWSEVGPIFVLWHIGFNADNLKNKVVGGGEVLLTDELVEVEP